MKIVWASKINLKKIVVLPVPDLLIHGHQMVFTYLGPPLFHLYFLVFCVQVSLTILLLNIPLR